jgi:hypothetical protein
MSTASVLDSVVATGSVVVAGSVVGSVTQYPDEASKPVGQLDTHVP